MTTGTYTTQRREAGSSPDLINLRSDGAVTKGVMLMIDDGSGNPIPVGPNSLPTTGGAVTGGATSANQLTEIASLATIATNTTPVAAGAKTSANSFPVVTAIDDANLGPAVIGTASAALSAVNQAVFGPLSCQGYTAALVQFNTVGTGNTYTFWISQNGTQWIATQAINTGLASSAAAANTANSNGMYYVPLMGAFYFQVTCIVYANAVSASANLISFSNRPIAIPYSYSQAIAPIGITNQGPSHAGKLICAATSTNATQVSAVAINLSSLIISNNNATLPWFCKFYNVASGLSVGTTVPVWTICVQPKTTIAFDIGPFATRFFTGFALAITGAAADTDTTTTGMAAGDVIICYNY